MAGYSKRIVCFANSRKPGGRCIAGREYAAGAVGGWVRPVSARTSAEISLDERRYENGQQPQVLDIITIPMLAHVPRGHQTENHLIDARYYWERTGVLDWDEVPQFVDAPPSLWSNGDSTYNGLNDRVDQNVAVTLPNSLFLVEPHHLRIQVQMEGGVFAPSKRRVRAEFRYNGDNYNFIVTDPVAEQAFLAHGDGVYAQEHAYLCVSLTEPYDGDGRCHKLVAAVITENPL